MYISETETVSFTDRTDNLTNNLNVTWIPSTRVLYLC